VDAVAEYLHGLIAELVIILEAEGVEGDFVLRHRVEDLLEDSMRFIEDCRAEDAKQGVEEKRAVRLHLVPFEDDGSPAS